MDRQAEIRAFLGRQHPDCAFVDRPPNPAGFGFGVKKGQLAPLVHIAQLWDRTAELSDKDFLVCLFGVGRVFDIVAQQTDRDPENYMDDTLELVRSEMTEDMPEVEAVMSQVFDLPPENLP